MLQMFFFQTILDFGIRIFFSLPNSQVFPAQRRFLIKDFSIVIISFTPNFQQKKNTLKGDCFDYFSLFLKHSEIVV